MTVWYINSKPVPTKVARSRLAEAFPAKSVKEIDVLMKRATDKASFTAKVLADYGIHCA